MDANLINYSNFSQAVINIIMSEDGGGGGGAYCNNSLLFKMASPLMRIKNTYELYSTIYIYSCTYINFITLFHILVYFLIKSFNITLTAHSM